jgi:hypothetical protein
MPNMPYILPDPVIALQQYLRLRSQITALTAATKVVSEIPTSPDYATPYVVVQSVGGVGIWPALDDAALQVDVIGGTKDLCSQVARAVRACVWAIANDRVTVGVLASGAEETAPAWLPDTVPNPPLSRFMSRYRVILHP